MQYSTRNNMYLPQSSDSVLVSNLTSNFNIIDAAIAKCKFDATGNPTAGDDSVDGYAVGSIWVNVSTGKIFECVDPTTGFAVWVPLGDVNGPASAVDENIACFDGITGKLLKDSLLTKANVADAISKKHTAASDDNFNGLSELTTIDPAADFLPFYDVSGSLYKKIKPYDLIGNHKFRTLQYAFDNGANAIPVDTWGMVHVNKACTIKSATLLASPSGSISISVYKCTYAQYDDWVTHPAVGDKISASAPMAISSAVKSQDSTLTGWTTALSSNDVVAFKVDSCTSITKCILILEVEEAW